MRLLVIRHAHYIPQGRDDIGAPLTEEGRSSVALVGSSLKSYFANPLIAHTPFRRTMETAHLLREHLGGTVREELEFFWTVSLDKRDLINGLKTLDNYILVGHDYMIFNILFLLGVTYIDIDFLEGLIIEHDRGSIGRAFYFTPNDIFPIEKLGKKG